MKALEFNHEADTVTAALSLDVGTIANKCNELAHRCVGNAEKFEASDIGKPSHLAEEIARTFSYKELVFMATQFILEQIESKVKKKANAVEAFMQEIAADDEMDDEKFEDYMRRLLKGLTD